MPITTTLSQTSDYRMVLTHYAPGEECRAHRHAGTQTSLLIAGGFREESEAGSLVVDSMSLSCKPSGFEHQNRFGDAGALILSVNGLGEASERSGYRIFACNTRAQGLGQLDRVASNTGEPDFPDQVRSEANFRNGPISPLLQSARLRLLVEPDLDIVALARSIGLHPIHFARVFRRAFGRPPAQVRRDHRTARAIDRIVRTSSPLAEIACSQGFADQAHMTRVISRTSGWSPGTLRRLLT